MRKIAIFLVISLSYYLYDIGNIDGVRQGTEALYVQIAKEMSESNNYLTPLYRGEPHWSKPPLQFWLGSLFLKAYGAFSLGVARSSMASVSFFSVLVLGFLLRKISKISLIETVILMLGCFGTLKFSRTFMMEVPLMFFPTLSLIFFYKCIKEQDNKSLGFSIVLGALSVLVKGQISIVMALISFGFYNLINLFFGGYLFNNFRAILKYSIGVTLLSSLWFLLCYLEYGTEFFNYFFIRENIGKFNQVDMPASRIIEGLIMFTFPWLFLLPAFLKSIKNIKHLSDFQIFCLSCFLGHYLIWFFPKQKSHHYAIPSLIFFIIFCFDYYKTTGVNKNIIRAFSFLGNSLLLILGSVCLYFSKDTVGFLSGLVGVSSIVISLYYLAKFNFKNYLVTTCISFFTVWCVCLPVFFIPLIPNNVVILIKKNPQSTVLLNDRRSFFFEQYLGRRVKVITAPEVLREIQSDNWVISSKYRLFNEKVPEKFIFKNWKKWKRKVRLNDFSKAITHRDLSYLKEDMFLFKK